MRISKLARRVGGTGLDNLPVAFVVGAVPLFVLVSTLLPTTVVVKAGYVLVAILCSLPLFYVTSGSGFEERTTPVSPGSCLKVVTVLGLGTLFAVEVTGSRLVPLLLFLPAAYLVVGTQLPTARAPVSFLGQLMVVFAVPLVAKYLVTGFYFGGTDTLVHVPAIEGLLASHSIRGIPGTYTYFPLFHVLLGSVSLLTTLPPYDSLVVTGILVYTLLVPVTYLAAREYFRSTRVARAVAVGFTVAPSVSYYSLYFFPQSLAIALFVVAALVFVRARTARSNHRRYTVLFLVLLFATTLTHHLTYLLLLPLVGVVVVVYGLQAGLDSLRRVRSGERVRHRSSGLLLPLVGLSMALVYWSFSQRAILTGFVVGLLGVVTVTTGGGTASYLFGVAPTTDTVVRALGWYLTPNGVFYSALALLFLMGFYEFVQHRARYGGQTSTVVAGLVAGGLLLPTPISLPAMHRFKLVLAVFALVPMGLGIARLFSVRARYRRYAAVSLVLLAVIGGVSSLTTTTADDVHAVHPGERQAQVAFTRAEYRMVSTTTGFVGRYGGGNPVSSDWITTRAFGAGAPPSIRQFAISRAGLSAPPGLVVVRDRWTRQKVGVGAGVTAADLEYFSVSRRRFDRTTTRQNVIFSTSATSVLWNDHGYRGLFGGRSNGTNRTSR